MHDKIAELPSAPTPSLSVQTPCGSLGGIQFAWAAQRCTPQAAAKSATASPVVCRGGGITSCLLRLCVLALRGDRRRAVTYKFRARGRRRRRAQRALPPLYLCEAADARSQSAGRRRATTTGSRRGPSRRSAAAGHAASRHHARTAMRCSRWRRLLAARGGQCAPPLAGGALALA